MLRRSLVVIGALAFAGAAVAQGAYAEEGGEEPTTSTTAKPTTTTLPPIQEEPTTTVKPTTTLKPTTTVKGATTTTVKGTGAPIPPPASGASQPLDPSLLGGIGPIDLNPTTTSTIGGLFDTEDEITTTTFLTDNAIDVSSTSNGPSGGMLGLAAVAWLASLGGLLVYAEDQRGKQWRHLAR